MSILGYSSAYFLPQYWANTPLYGEKLIPLLDYILSTDYVHTDKLASAFYDIQSKYKNTADLPIDKIEAIIEESGYKYVRDLMGEDEESLKLLVYLLVMIHQLKGSKRGLETVLSLLRVTGNELELSIAGNLDITNSKEVTGFSTDDYLIFSNFTAEDIMKMEFQIKTGRDFSTEQAIASSPDYGFYLGIDTQGRLVLQLGKETAGIRSWQEINNKIKFVSEDKLSKNTNYYITLAYNGHEYTVKVTTGDGESKYFLYLKSEAPLSIKSSLLYLGIDRTTSEAKHPLKSTLFLGSFSIALNNVKITQWFEVFPVDVEDTFFIEAALDVNRISPDFFVNFAKFVERYVYPSLRAFKTRLVLKSKITFLPYVRQRVTYIASNLIDSAENFQVVEDSTHIPYEVEDGQGYHEDYLVQRHD